MVTHLILFLSGAVLTIVSLSLLIPKLPKRRNFTNANIPTSAGLAFIPIILTVLVLAIAGILELGSVGVVYLAYALLAVVVGASDDLWGDTGAKGFRGHLGALRDGAITTGLIKLLVLGGGAVVFGVLLYGFTFVALLAAFMMAGSVNLANLLDLRPGRALKFLSLPLLILIFLVPPMAVQAIAGMAGGAAGIFYFDLKGRIMLGDAGAAVYGSVLGYLVVMSGPGLIWWVAGIVILGVTVLAEVSSISRVIQEVGVLRRFDSWGRGSDE